MGTFGLMLCATAAGIGIASRDHEHRGTITALALVMGAIGVFMTIRDARRKGDRGGW